MLEHVTANIAGTVRREILDGREHIVAPLTLIVPGVLNGSRGALLYPEDELVKSPDAWNRVPIVVYHPTNENGEHVSAHNQDVLNKTGIGVVLKAAMNGKLVAEGWFDVENTKRVDRRVFEALEKGQPLELSTGLQLDAEETPGEYNGAKYRAVARNYRPDHLAILPDQTGACSIKDGCGVYVNEGRSQWLSSLVESIKLELQKEAAMPKKLSDEKRKEIVEYMIANCECWAENDREVLNGMSDEKLTSLKSHVEKHQQAEAVANAVRKGFEHGDVGFTFNEEKLEFEGKEKPKEKPVENKKQDPPKPQTADEWLEAAPPEVQSVVRNALETERLQKLALIETITGNKSNVYTKDQLLVKPIEDLRAIAALAKTETPKPSYFGASVPVGNQTNEDEDDILPLPTIEWAKKA